MSRTSFFLAAACVGAWCDLAGESALTRMMDIGINNGYLASIKNMIGFFYCC